MMRRWRCIAVTTLVGLLAFATSASAECAWVLWEELRTISPPNSGLEWAIVGSATKQEDCSEFSTRAVADRVTRWRRVKEEGTGKPVDVQATGNQVDVRDGKTFLWYR